MDKKYCLTLLVQCDSNYQCCFCHVGLQFMGVKPFWLLKHFGVFGWTLKMAHMFSLFKWGRDRSWSNSARDQRCLLPETSGESDQWVNRLTKWRDRAGEVMKPAAVTVKEWSDPMPSWHPYEFFFQNGGKKWESVLCSQSSYLFRLKIKQHSTSTADSASSWPIIFTSQPNKGNWVFINKSFIVRSERQF